MIACQLHRRAATLLPGIAPADLSAPLLGHIAAEAARLGVPSPDTLRIALRLVPMLTLADIVALLAQAEPASAPDALLHHPAAMVQEAALDAGIRLSRHGCQALADLLLAPPPPCDTAEPRPDTLDEAGLLDALAHDQPALAARILAQAASVQLAVVRRAARLRHRAGLVALVWQAGFSMQAAGPVQVALGGIAPEEVLRARPGGGFPLPAVTMRWQIAMLSDAEPLRDG